MTKEYKLTYMISGKTKAGTWCSQGFSSSIETAIDFWVKKFPRFNGHGIIKKQMAEYLPGGIVIADGSKWESVLIFNNNKELRDKK
jgi:hypothetical protein